MLQSILFDDKYFRTKSQVKKWLKKHDFKYSKIVHEANRWRARQAPPKKGVRYYSKKLKGKPSVTLVMYAEKK